MFSFNLTNSADRFIDSRALLKDNFSLRIALSKVGHEMRA